MTTDAEHAVRNQQMIVLVLGLATARALVRNRIIVVIGLAARGNCRAPEGGRRVGRPARLGGSQQGCLAPG